MQVIDSASTISARLVPIVVGAVASLVGNLVRERASRGGIVPLVGAAMVGAVVGAGLVVLAVPESRLRAIRREAILRARAIFADATPHAAPPL